MERNAINIEPSNKVPLWNTKTEKHFLLSAVNTTAEIISHAKSKLYSKYKYDKYTDTLS